MRAVNDILADVAMPECFLNGNRSFLAKQIQMKKIPFFVNWSLAIFSSLFSLAIEYYISHIFWSFLVLFSVACLVPGVLVLSVVEVDFFTPYSSLIFISP